MPCHRRRCRRKLLDSPFQQAELEETRIRRRDESGRRSGERWTAADELYIRCRWAVSSSQSARPQQLTDSRVSQSPLSCSRLFLTVSVLDNGSSGSGTRPPPPFPVQPTDGRTLHRAHARAQTRNPCARPWAWSAGRRRHCRFLGRRRKNQEQQRSLGSGGGPHVHNTCTFVYKCQTLTN